MVGVRKQPCSASALNHAQVRGEEMPQQNTSCICLLENKYWFRVYLSIWSFFSFAFCLRRGAVHFKGCALGRLSLFALHVKSLIVNQLHLKALNSMTPSDWHHASSGSREIEQLKVFTNACSQLVLAFYGSAYCFQSLWKSVKSNSSPDLYDGAII